MRNGADAKRYPNKRTGDPGHTYLAVYTEMLLQICTDYPGLPDVRTLTASNIRFFYNGLRSGLHKTTSTAKK